MKEMTINRPNLTIKMMGRTRDATELAICTLKRVPQAFGSLLIQIQKILNLCDKSSRGPRPGGPSSRLDTAAHRCIPARSRGAAGRNRKYKMSSTDEILLSRDLPEISSHDIVSILQLSSGVSTKKSIYIFRTMQRVIYF